MVFSDGELAVLVSLVQEASDKRGNHLSHDLSVGTFHADARVLLKKLVSELGSRAILSKPPCFRDDAVRPPALVEVLKAIGDAAARDIKLHVADDRVNRLMCNLAPYGYPHVDYDKLRAAWPLPDTRQEEQFCKGCLAVAIGRMARARP